MTTATGKCSTCGQVDPEAFSSCSNAFHRSAAGGSTGLPGRPRNDQLPDGGRADCWCAKSRKPCEYHQGFEDGVEAEVDADRFDFETIIREVGQVYDEITMGRFSKP